MKKNNKAAIFFKARAWRVWQARRGSVVLGAAPICGPAREHGYGDADDERVC